MNHDQLSIVANGNTSTSEMKKTDSGIGRVGITSDTDDVIALLQRTACGIEEKNKMLGDVAHDLRGLLTIIKGYTEMLMQEGMVTNTSLQKEVYCKILRSCTMMAELIDNCLDISRIESGQLVVEKQDVDLTVHLKECVAPFTIKAQSKSMDLTIDMDESLPHLRLDPLCLSRIIGNLISNAIKFSHPNSTIAFTARARRDYVEIEVRDHGQGVPQEEIPLIFEPYRKGSARPTGGERATGLGLAIVKKLAEANGWQISLVSEVGKGSTFGIRLPWPCNTAIAEPPTFAPVLA